MTRPVVTEHFVVNEDPLGNYEDQEIFFFFVIVVMEVVFLVLGWKIEAHFLILIIAKRIFLDNKMLRHNWTCHLHGFSILIDSSSVNIYCFIANIGGSRIVALFIGPLLLDDLIWNLLKIIISIIEIIRRVSVFKELFSNHVLHEVEFFIWV